MRNLDNKQSQAEAGQDVPDRGLAVKGWSLSVARGMVSGQAKPFGSLAQKPRLRLVLRRVLEDLATRHWMLFGSHRPPRACHPPGSKALLAVVPVSPGMSLAWPTQWVPYS